MSIRQLNPSIVQRMRASIAASDVVYIVEDLVLNAIDAQATSVHAKVFAAGCI
jgi:DNA mismatch repair ATPase MutL